MSLLRREPAFVIHWPVEAGVLGGAVLVWAGGEYLRVRRAPRTPVERSAQQMLNGFDRWARGLLKRAGREDLAGRISDALAYVAVPLACQMALFSLDHRPRAMLGNGLRVLRAVTATGALNQAIKFAAPRERPFVNDSPETVGKDRYGSFFSNHTSAVTAMAAATTRIALEHGARPWFGLPLLGLALFVGYLRIAADQHYLTDVLFGAAFGSLLGMLSPR